MFKKPSKATCGRPDTVREAAIPIDPGAAHAAPAETAPTDHDPALPPAGVGVGASATDSPVATDRGALLAADKPPLTPTPGDPSSLPASAGAEPKPASKRALVVALLRREDGATLAELVAATGWQAHSTRAVLTGLRKQGLMLDKSIRDGVTCYQILEAARA